MLVAGTSQGGSQVQLPGLPGRVQPLCNVYLVCVRRLEDGAAGNGQSIDEGRDSQFRNQAKLREALRFALAM